MMSFGSKVSETFLNTKALNLYLTVTISRTDVSYKCSYYIFERLLSHYIFQVHYKPNVMPCLHSQILPEMVLSYIELV